MIVLGFVARQARLHDRGGAVCRWGEGRIKVSSIPTHALCFPVCYDMNASRRSQGLSSSRPPGARGPGNEVDEKPMLKWLSYKKIDRNKSP